MELVSPQHNRQQNRSRAVRQQWGQKVLKRTHIFAHTICVRNGIDSVVLYNACNFRPGLDLQCMIVVFPGHTHFFGSFICTVETE